MKNFLKNALNKVCEVAQDVGAKTLALVSGTSAVVGSLFTSKPAMAAVPVAVTDAITTMSADAVIVATAVLVGIIAVVAIKFIRKGL